MASKVDVCNIALQKLGAGRISSIDDDTPAARACKIAYDHCLPVALRKHPWRFSIKRSALAADATSPDWGKDYAYELPSDWLRMLTPYPEDNANDIDYEIEGHKIYTDMSDPLYIRYVALIDDVGIMDALFREVLACDMADQMCEALTQSNSKKATIAADKKSAIAEARRANAIESISAEPPEDTWVTVRD